MSNSAYCCFNIRHRLAVTSASRPQLQLLLHLLLLLLTPASTPGCPALAAATEPSSPRQSWPRTSRRCSPAARRQTAAAPTTAGTGRTKTRPARPAATCSSSSSSSSSRRKRRGGSWFDLFFVCEICFGPKCVLLIDNNNKNWCLCSSSEMHCN